MVYKYRFSEMDKAPFALEYGDINLISRHSNLPPTEEISLKSYLTNSIELKGGPLVSSPMPNVTGPEMCIVLGLTGNFGVLPKAIDIEDQVAQAKEVKKFSSGFILNPDTLSPEDLVDKALAIKSVKGYDTFPVTHDGSPHGKLVGLLEKFNCSQKYRGRKVSEIMKPLSDLKEVGVLLYERPDLKDAEELMRDNGYSKLLIVDSSGYLDSMSTWADVMKRENFPNATMDKYGRIMCGAAVGGPGKIEDLEERAQRLIEEAEVDALFVETAQGDSMGVINLTKKLLDDYTKSYDIPVIWGNVDNEKSAERLSTQCCEEIDAIKVGIGPGSICTTKQVTGFGNPQLTAVYECSKVAREYDIRCIADGGIGSNAGVASGNIVKAICAGADTVMVGGLLAGTDESPGNIIEVDGKKYKRYFGMSSVEGLKLGGGTRYYLDLKEAVVQGKEFLVPYSGSAEDVVRETTKNIAYALRVHAGVRSFQELRKDDLEFSIRPSYTEIKIPEID